jgi:hypothetical protein
MAGGEEQGENDSGGDEHLDDAETLGGKERHGGHTTSHRSRTGRRSI